MANSKSSKKRVLVNERNRLRNQAVRSTLRTQVKVHRAAVAAGDEAESARLLSSAYSVIDKTAKKGVIHERTAQRYKSRLARAHARLTAGKASS